MTRKPFHANDTIYASIAGEEARRPGHYAAPRVISIDAAKFASRLPSRRQEGARATLFLR